MRNWMSGKTSTEDKLCRPDTPLNVELSGQGRPSVLFVHGFGCALDDWRATIDILSANRLCIAVDLPGHGGSGLPRSNNIESLACAVNAVVKTIAEGDVVLVGHSLGTKVIRECLRQSSDRVAAIVMVDGSTYLDDPEALTRRLIDDVERVGFDRYVEELFEKMFVEGTPEALVHRFKERAGRLDRDFAVDILKDSIRWDVVNGDDTLRSLNVPALLVQSTYFKPGIGRSFLTPDLTTPFMEKVATLAYRAEVATMTDIGHFPMIEAPQSFAALVERFLEGL
jgi:pimeloyl-ACP methyl ester carboxylesterase